MKKISKIIILVLTLIFSISLITVGGCGVFKKAKKLSYVEWSDSESRICFRTMDGCFGCGYITLSGKKLDAEFCFGAFGKQYIGVTVCTKELEYEEEDAEEITTEYFSASDLNKQGQVVSSEKDVVLFGEHFGQIVLTYKEIEPQSVDAWEYLYSWTDSIGNFKLTATSNCYFYNKLRTAEITTPKGKENFNFKWIPEGKKFAIYKYDDFAEKEILAEGTYTNFAEKATLTFTNDSIFNWEFKTVDIEIEKR